MLLGAYLVDSAEPAMQLQCLAPPPGKTPALQAEVDDRVAFVVSADHKQASEMQDLCLQARAPMVLGRALSLVLFLVSVQQAPPVPTVQLRHLGVPLL